MNHDHHGGRHAPSDGPQRRAVGSRTKVVFAILLAIAAFFLLTEHRAHLFGYLPYILLLACPLLHMFHHGGHGGHGGHRHGADDGRRRGDAQQAARKET